MSCAPCPQHLCQHLELVTTEKGWAWVREGSRLLGLQSAGGHCGLLVTAIYFKKKYRKIRTKTPKFAACCCFYTQPGLWYVSHLVQKGWKRLAGEVMSLQVCNTWCPDITLVSVPDEKGAPHSCNSNPVGREARLINKFWETKLCCRCSQVPHCHGSREWVLSLPETKPNNKLSCCWLWALSYSKRAWV